MKNREWLASMALYDLLMMIAKNVDDGCTCPLSIVEGDLPYITAYCDTQESCIKCLQNWLNDERVTS